GRPAAFLEPSHAWIADARHRLPPDLTARLGRKAYVDLVKKRDDDLLLLLVRACPGERDVPRFISWVGGLTAGSAYEGLAPLLPDKGPALPREFNAWRDAQVELLDGWNAAYFGEIDS